MTAITATALAVVLAMARLTALALSSRDNVRRQKERAVGSWTMQAAKNPSSCGARRQKGPALSALYERRKQRALETMVELMQTELPSKLMGQARLAVRNAINQRALDDYSGREGGVPSTASVVRRS